MMKNENIKTEWDLSLLYEGDPDEYFEKERKEITKKVNQFVNKWKNDDSYKDSPDKLKEALDEFEELSRLYSPYNNEAYFYQKLYDLDQTNTEIKAKANKVEEFGNNLMSQIQFFPIEISKTPPEKQQEFLNSNKLKKYKHWIEKQYALQPHVLSEEGEKIMLLKSGPAHSNWTNMVSEFLSSEQRKVLNKEGEEEIKSFSEITGLLINKTKKVRDRAAEKFNDILLKNVDVAEAELNSVLENKKVNDVIRNYDRPDKDRHLSDDIETETVETLVATVTENFTLTKKYYELKAKLMNVEKLEYHERNVEIGEIDKEYSFEDSLNLLSKVFKNLDQEFEEIFYDFLENGQVDVFPKKGKRGGAYCGHYHLKQPIYILLNHNDSLSDVLIFAHEVGHGINNELVRKRFPQNELNFGTSTATAEVASTFTEDFVLEELRKDADDETKLALMMMQLNDEVSTIFRQVAFYNFETELHKKFRAKGYLSKEEIGELFKKHMESYMGDYVEQSEGSENWWTYVPHFRYFFYVYSYASGLLISKNMQRKVREDSEFIETVKKFLSASLSDSPKNIFLDMGIDISKKSFWEEGIKEFEDLLKEAETLAVKLGKIDKS